MTRQTVDPTTHAWYADYKYIGGFPKHDLPEWSHVLIDSSHLPTREVHGWRSILVSAIKSGAISYNAAVREFGNPESDQRSTRWYSQLKGFIYGR